MMYAVFMVRKALKGDNSSSDGHGEGKTKSEYKKIPRAVMKNRHEIIPKF
jgi:hypothetical protein